MSHKNLGTARHWKKLKSLAEAQTYQCIYTNDKLIPGLNMSLDHIDPKSINPLGKYNVGNVQWVTTNVNMAKSNLSNSDFLLMCKRIYDHSILKVHRDQKDELNTITELH